METYNNKETVKISRTQNEKNRTKKFNKEILKTEEVGGNIK